MTLRLSVLLISFLILLVYYPSFWHVTRSDQEVYFAVTEHKQGLWDLTAGCYHLNRREFFAAGDERLFRPLLFMFLGLEKFMFGTAPMGWQIVGVLLHTAVAGCLLRLLWRLAAGWGAVLAASLFALLFVNMEMVIWPHVNGYMIFALLTLIALEQGYAYVVQGFHERWRLWVIVGVLGPACFIYETANIFIVFMFIFLIQQQGQAKILRWLWVIPLAYGAISLLDFIRTYHAFPSMASGQALSLMGIVMDTAKVLGFWLFGGLFPMNLQMFFAVRNMLAPMTLPLLSLQTWWAVSPVIVLGGGYAYALSQSSKRLGTQGAFLLLLAMMMTAYAAIIAVGRGSQHALDDILHQNTHYFYVFWALAVVFLYGLIDISAMRQRWIKIVMALMAIGLIAINGTKLYQINDFQAKAMNASYAH